MVTCIKCGRSLMKECTCFANDIERLKEYGRLAQRELDVIIDVLENNRPLFMRLTNDESLTVQASVSPLKNGFIAHGNFALTTQGIKHFKRLELLDWNKQLVYFRPEDIALEKMLGSETRVELQWKLEAT